MSFALSHPCSRVLVRRGSQVSLLNVLDICLLGSQPEVIVYVFYRGSSTQFWNLFWNLIRENLLMMPFFLRHCSLPAFEQLELREVSQN